MLTCEANVSPKPTPLTIPTLSRCPCPLRSQSIQDHTPRLLSGRSPSMFKLNPQPSSSRSPSHNPHLPSPMAATARPHACTHHSLVCSTHPSCKRSASLQNMVTMAIQHSINCSLETHRWAKSLCFDSVGRLQHVCKGMLIAWCELHLVSLQVFRAYRVIC